MNIIIFGPQGSGKGTQAKMIAEKFGIAHISTGQILREMPRDTPLGKKVHEIMQTGKLHPDDMIIKIVTERLAKDDCKRGFILDGVPRTLNQAKMLKAKIDYAIYLDIPDKETIRRLSSRSQCRTCNAIYGLANQPKRANVCDKCGGELYRREDDNPALIAKRLETFHKETEPLLDFYKHAGTLHVVDGKPPIEEIFKTIVKILK